MDSTRPEEPAHRFANVLTVVNARGFGEGLGRVKNV